MRLAVLLSALCAASGVLRDRVYDKIQRSLAERARARTASAGAPLLLREPHSFVRGARPEPARRAPRLARWRTTTKHPDYDKNLNVKILDMLRQAIYVTQGRMRELEPLLEEHRQQTALRMAFMFNRLQQLAEDMRRIYTLSQRKQYQFRMFYQLTWHTHVVRKYLDVLYTVEHVIRTHAAFVEPLKMELEKMGMAVDG